MIDKFKMKDRSEFASDYFRPVAVCSLSRMYLFGVAVMRILMVTLYHYTGFTILGNINIISFVVYSVLAVIITNRTMRTIYMFAIVEIVSFVLTNVAVFGWNYNLYICSFIIISLGILTSISLNKDRYNYWYPLVIFVVTHVLFLVLMVKDFMYDAQQSVKLSEEAQKLFEIQGIVSYIFVTLALFSPLLAFVIDLNAAAKHADEINKQLYDVSSHDKLTKLINRRSMSDIFDYAIKSYWDEKNQFSLILADIDNFKKVNDTYGHNKGDEVLQKIASIITEKVGEYGHVCRWGGEEIMILIEDDKYTAIDMAQIIRKAVAQEVFESENGEFSVTLTQGVSQFSDLEDINKTITDVDSKLYEGKQSTKNCVIS